MLGTLFNLSKAAVAVAVTPLAAAVDVVTLPPNAERGAPPFGRAARCLGQAGKAFDAAIEPSESANELMK
jgi:hypothetical protein